MSALLFNGDSGRKPQSEARRYALNVLVAMIDHQIEFQDEWMFGGVTEEADRRRVKKALVRLRAEMRKRGGR